MKGLGELIKTVKFIELECSIMEYNQGGCKFHEIVEFLKDNFPNSNLKFISHHIAHAFASIYSSSFNEGSFLTLDGTGSLFNDYYEGHNNNFNCIKSIGIICNCVKCRVGKWTEPYFQAYCDIMEELDPDFDGIQVEFSW